MSFVVSKHRQADLICLIKQRKNEFSEKLKDENMAMKTLTISRILEGILRKEFHKMQDVVKMKTKAVENYRQSRHCRIGFKLFSILTCYVI